MPTIKQRVTINLSDNEYGELAALAEKHDLSMAWIGHKAIVDFLEKTRGELLQLPLTFAKRPTDRPPSLNKRDAAHS
jgi:hypothetical protein